MARGAAKYAQYLANGGEKLANEDNDETDRAIVNCDSNQVELSKV